MLGEKINKDFPFEGGGDYRSPFNNGRVEPRYVLARGVRGDGSVALAAIYVVPPVDGKNGGVYLEIVEPKPMETGKVTASLGAGEMAKIIAADGRVAVYGVFFDTDKAEVKPESKPALMEMAKLLMQDVALRVYIVGHTDSTGTLGRNLELSELRAN